jgi:hypothetical protein
MTVSVHRAIENLIARYAELVDDGDFAQRHVRIDLVGDLSKHLRHAK